MVVAMSLSGGLIGMASAFFRLGLASAFFRLGPPVGWGGPTHDMGYTALALALVAGLRPAWWCWWSVLYSALNTGAKSMVIATGIPLDLIVVIIALAMMFVAAPGIIRSIWRVKVAKPAAEFLTVPASGQGEPL